MSRKELVLDIFRNKRNNQFSVAIPKKKIKKDLCPRKLILKDWEWIE